MPATLPLDLEAFLFQDPGQILRGLELLKAQFAEAEDRSTITCACFFMASIWPARSAFIAFSFSVEDLLWPKQDVKANKMIGKRLYTDYSF